MKKVFAFILGITALSLAITAAFYSVYGLSKLFAGASLAITILASILEFSKIVVVSFLHQFWKKIHWIMKMYLSIAVVLLMFITSAGIYGFLASAYSVTSEDLAKSNGVIEMYNQRINTIKESKETLIEQMQLKNNRIKTLINLRKSQETRLDSLYQRGWYRSARKTEKIINNSNEDIKKISKEVNEINQNIQNLNDTISSYEIKKLNINNSNVIGEIGPLKYVALMFNKDVDSVANWLMLLFIFLIDPLSIFLVLSTNRIIKLISEENKNIKKQKRTVEKTEKVIDVQENTKEIKESKEKSKENVEKLKENVEAVQYKNNLENNKIELEDEINIDGNMNAEGAFTAETPLTIIQNEDKKIKQYLFLLEKFYKNGKAKKGDKIPLFIEFKKELNTTNLVIEDKIIKDFLVICGLLNIIKYDNKQGTYNKEYFEAVGIISKI